MTRPDGPSAFFLSLREEARGALTEKAGEKPTEPLAFNLTLTVSLGASFSQRILIFLKKNKLISLEKINLLRIIWFQTSFKS
jgi:hypothetical protein